jgi:hypothetical protein
MSLFESLPDHRKSPCLRLLWLYPGNYNDRVRCKLEVITYEDSKDQYEAISYCWGDCTDQVNLSCNGIDVRVTRSLADALRAFRNSHKVRVLWADALCIDQMNDKEKGQQVGRMNEVFANAHRVLVWLGHDLENLAKRSFDMIRDINQYFGHEFIRCYQNFTSMSLLVEPYPSWVQESQWEGVTEMLSLPWFRRVWTLQVPFYIRK